MPITFSEKYNISNDVIERNAVFDVIMDVDTQVFIDPALLELCTEKEFINAKSKAEKYFAGIITLLKHSKNTTVADVSNVVGRICSQYKTLIEDNGLSNLLYDSTGKSKHESAAQLLFYGIADSYCAANNIDLSPESNAGRGPVDFKLSRGSTDKVIVEVKLTSNPQLKHGIEKQVPIYMAQEKTKKAIYLIIDNGHPKTTESFIKFYNALGQEIKSKISCFIIDGTKKPSASKA